MRKVGLLVAAFYLMGCGAIMHGNRQDITVQSSPSGAKVETSPVSGIYSTPATLNLERKNSYVLTFTKDGYTPASMNIHNGIGPGTLVADVLLGLVGVVVDAATGSWYGLSPESGSVTLVKAGGTSDDADAIHIAIGTSNSKGSVTVTSSAPGVSLQLRRK